MAPVPAPETNAPPVRAYSPGFQVSVGLLRALADVLQQRGVSPQRVLGGAAGLLQADPIAGRIALQDFHALLARGTDLTGEPALGLYCGLQAAEPSFGLVSPLISHTPSLRRAIELIVRFHPLLLEGTRIELSERLGVATVRCEHPRVSAAADRALSELIVAGLCRTLRTFGCAPADIRAYCFEHERPAHHAAYTEAFGGAECFAQPFCGVTFDAAALDRPNIHDNPALESLLCGEAERSMQRLGAPPSCTDRVLAVMRRQTPGQAQEMPRVARALGISVRSLRRRLQEEDTSFRALEQRVLETTACDLLRDPQHTFQSIAHQLGFASSTAFHRAFKRWTQRTPAEYRALALSTPYRS